MPLTNEIMERVGALSSANKQGEVVNYLQAVLTQKIATAQEVFEYARHYVFTKEPKPYVIHANVITHLGVIVSALDEQHNLAAQFHHLAAERGSALGNRNYAFCLLNGLYGSPFSPEWALHYATKAVELTHPIPNEKHEHKFIYCLSLRQNQQWAEGSTALMEYFAFKSHQAQSTNDVARKNAIDSDIRNALALCKTILDEVNSHVQQDSQNQSELVEAGCRYNLTVLTPILQCKIISAEFNPLKLHARFLQAKCHEILKENALAWAAYCAISDKNFPLYNDVIAARARLLKNEVRAIENAAVTAKMAALAITNEKKAKSSQEEIILPQGIPLPTKFSEEWTRDTPWFHSVDKKALQAKFDKRVQQLEILVQAKKAEIALVDETLKEGGNSEEFIQKIQLFKTELEKLHNAKRLLEDKYQQYLPENRSGFRRHMAESLFYNPVRSNKIADIANLTMDIIDHRFPTRGASPAPIPLEGKSARLLISAEKMFQEAVIALSGRECPQLGIPTMREKPWTVGWGYNQRSGTTGYGPVEFYKVGDTHIQAEHRTNPKRQRVGDSFLPDLGNYDSIYYNILLNLIRDDPKKEKQLASFMLRFGRHHQPVTLQELKSIDEKADESSVDHFNQLCFLIMEKEQGQWQSVTDERFQLGMSVAQARCLIMIEAGFIRFEEAFKNGVLLGIYSHTRIADDPSHVAQSCKYIDELYMRYLQSKNINDSMTFFKKHIKTDEPPSLVPTREQAHSDLTYAYGGGSDTDGDDEYDSDLSM